MYRPFQAVFAAAILLGGPAAAAEPATSIADRPARPPLTREAAVEHALRSAPNVEAAAARLRAARANIVQARVLPNPQIGMEVENFGSAPAYRGFDSSEATLSLSQTIELGGKRAARAGLAEAARRVAGYDYAAARQDLTHEVRRAFTEAVSATEETKLAEERRTLAGEVLRAVQGRVEAGREPVLQQRRSEIALRQSEIALKNALRRQAIAHDQLALLIGLSPDSFEPDGGGFTMLDAPNAPDGGGQSLDLLQRQADVARSRAELRLENSRGIPDLTVSAGVRRFQETDDTAFIAGISIPIPVFDRNRGAIERARESVTAAEADLRARRLQRARELDRTRAALAEAKDNALTLAQAIVPAAEEAFRFASEGYRQGKFSYLEVLDAQRSLFEARRSQIDALQRFHDAAADLARLSATEANEEK